MKREIVKKLNQNSELGTLVQKVRVTNGEEESYYVIKRIRNISLPLCKTIFEKETQALSKLKGCSNIVRFYKSEVREQKDGSKEGIISMEYIDGKPLASIIHSAPTIAVRYQLVKQLIHAVRYAHNNLIIHRDINPQNILVTDSNQLKLIDFGISKIYGLIQDGTTYQFATHGYAAPEVTIHSENASERSDIYSIGAVIWTLFTGKLPPQASNFTTYIKRASGMDIILKRVLCKMCAYDPQERYSDLDECEDDLAPLYQTYCSSDEKYYFAVSFKTKERLRSLSLVRKNATSLDIEQYLEKQFIDCYASISGQDQDIYRFDGRNITIDCVFDNDIFHIASIKKIDAYKREDQKRFAFPVSGRCCFVNSVNVPGIRNNCTMELYNRINDFFDDATSQQNIDREYENQYGIWRIFIQAMIQDVANSVEKLDYIGVKYVEGEMLFQLKENGFIEHTFSQDTVFVIEEKSKGTKKPRVRQIGSFVEFRDDGFILVVKPFSKLYRVPGVGMLSVDYSKEILQYRRQETAFEEFRRSETISNGNLKSILVGAEEPRVFRSIQNSEFFDQQLDITQKRAVRKILNAEDIAMIQGPPGTGKTNVLVEVIRQILAENANNPSRSQRMLIVSQSHAAVDKVLEDISPYISRDATTIRIGSPEKIKQPINSRFGLKSCQDVWAREAIENSYNKLDSILKKLNICVEDFSSYAKAFDDLRIANLKEEDKASRKRIVQDFENQYQIDSMNVSLQICLTLYKWIHSINENNPLGEYYVKNAVIVAGTCSGFIADPNVKDMVFDYVFIDEAAKATLPEIMVSMVRAQKVVLVGDHMQLPPMIDQEALRNASEKISAEELRNVGFGKLFEMLPAICKETLSTQYRMHPCIGELVSSLFYKGQVQNGVSAEERAIELPTLKGSAITWISTSRIGDKRFEQSAGSSFENTVEVSIILEQLKQIDKEMTNSPVTYTIGIITPYKAQLELIKKRLLYQDLKQIKVDINTVDAFQGSQRDIIIYSTVRSSTTRSIGFLKEHSRLNVSFSRAKRALIIIGDADFLENNRDRQNVFPSVLHYIKERTDYCRLIYAEDSIYAK